jgi:hypothetical protein
MVFQSLKEHKPTILNKMQRIRNQLEQYRNNVFLDSKTKKDSITKDKMTMKMGKAISERGEVSLVSKYSPSIMSSDTSVTNVIRRFSQEIEARGLPPAADMRKSSNGGKTNKEDQRRNICHLTNKEESQEHQNFSKNTFKASFQAFGTCVQAKKFRGRHHYHGHIKKQENKISCDIDKIKNIMKKNGWDHESAFLSLNTNVNQKTHTTQKTFLKRNKRLNL